MNKKLLMSIFCIITLSSCSEDVIDDAINHNTYAEDNSIITPDYISSLGLDTVGIVDCGTYYLVENDIIVNKHNNNIKIGQTRSYRADNYTSNHRIVNIKFDISVPESSKWRKALKQVISFYNYNTGLKLQEAYGNVIADVTIKLDYIHNEYMQIVTEAIAVGEFPTSPGAIGHTITINQYSYTWLENHYSVDQIAHILKHEFGHCLGLRHSDCIITGENDDNGIGATLIDGTPQEDPDSYMNSGDNNTGNGYSSYDLIALKTLWPYEYKVSFKNCNLDELPFEYHTTPYRLSRFIIPKSSGKVFAGWHHTNIAYSPFTYDYKITDNKTLYATWREPYTRKVVNGNTYGGTDVRAIQISSTSVATLTCTVQRGLNTWSQLETAWGTNTILEKEDPITEGRYTIYKFEMKEHIVYPWPSGQTITKSIDLVLDPGVYYLTSAFTPAFGDQNLGMGNHGATLSKLEY